jgi:hypothetical protein
VRFFHLSLFSEDTNPSLTHNSYPDRRRTLRHRDRRFLRYPHRHFPPYGSPTLADRHRLFLQLHFYLVLQHRTVLGQPLAAVLGRFERLRSCWRFSPSSGTMRHHRLPHPFPSRYVGVLQIESLAAVLTRLRSFDSRRCSLSNGGCRSGSFLLQGPKRFPRRKLLHRYRSPLLLERLVVQARC